MNGAEKRLSLTANGNVRYDVKGITSVAGAWTGLDGLDGCLDGYTHEISGLDGDTHEILN